MDGWMDGCTYVRTNIQRTQRLDSNQLRAITYRVAWLNTTEWEAERSGATGKIRRQDKRYVCRYRINLSLELQICLG